MCCAWEGVVPTCLSSFLRVSEWSGHYSFVLSSFSIVRELKTRLALSLGKGSLPSLPLSQTPTPSLAAERLPLLSSLPAGEQIFAEVNSDLVYFPICISTKSLTVPSPQCLISPGSLTDLGSACQIFCFVLVPKKRLNEHWNVLLSVNKNVQ